MLKEVKSLPDPHPSEGLAEGDQVLAPPAPLSVLTPSDLQFWLPAMGNYRDTQLALAKAQKEANAAIDALNFIADLLRKKPIYQIAELDKIDEDGRIIRES